MDRYLDRCMHGHVERWLEMQTHLPMSRGWYVLGRLPPPCCVRPARPASTAIPTRPTASTTRAWAFGARVDKAFLVGRPEIVSKCVDKASLVSHHASRQFTSRMMIRYLDSMCPDRLRFVCHSHNNGVGL